MPVWLYLRFTLSYPIVEDLLAERGSPSETNTLGFCYAPKRPYKPLFNELRTLSILISCHHI
jgi:hypothetical protein